MRKIGYCILSLTLFFLLFALIHSVDLAQSETMTVLKNVETVYLVDVSKKDRGACYSGKLVWDGEKWRRQIAVYNNSPDPPASHPVRNYVKNIHNPAYKGQKKWEPFQFREFPCQP
ncbi:MAG: hypothetical protein K9K75_06255 [Deltaproteobacteria bacterium]|nr:hypothetical protein [Deltaproteobacteria bacterium]